MKRFILLMLVGLPLNAFAHDWSGNLGEDVSATDYIMIYCSADGSIPADRLFLKLTSDSPAGAPLISAQIAKGSLVTNVTDLINGDTTSSREADVAAGEGVYRVTVNKNKVGKVSYSFAYHCQSNSGEHSETNATTLQDQ